MFFAAANLEISPLAPLASAFGIALCCSTAGISGAFLLLPFQLSVLGYTSPGVSATNQLFNIIACPGGIYRFAREGRLLLPLTLFIAAGTLPGVFAGAIIRLTLLPEAARFKIFAGLVLLGIGLRMLLNTRKNKSKAKAGPCHVTAWSFSGFSFVFQKEVFHVSGAAILLLSLAVGLVGGIYGIGGGAIISPFLVTFFGLPVYAIAGACLFATFLASVAGASFYALLGWAFSMPAALPDWGLGLLFGLGGLCGMYCGAALQKFIPAQILRLFLIFVLLGVAIFYLAA